MARERGMSARKMALSVGMTQPGFTAMVERGSMETKILLRSADVLGMSPTHLLVRLMPSAMLEHFGLGYGNDVPLSVAAEPGGSYLTEDDLAKFLAANKDALQKLIDKL